jgi:hypothetical protein
LIWARALSLAVAASVGAMFDGALQLILQARTTCTAPPTTTKNNSSARNPIVSY